VLLLRDLLSLRLLLRLRRRHRPRLLRLPLGLGLRRLRLALRLRLLRLAFRPWLLGLTRQLILRSRLSLALLRRRLLGLRSGRGCGSRACCWVGGRA
jgi:hypothetical protein